MCEVNASHDDFEQIYKDVELALFETLETVITFIFFNKQKFYNYIKHIKIKIAESFLSKLPSVSNLFIDKYVHSCMNLLETNFG